MTVDVEGGTSGPGATGGRAGTTPGPVAFGDVLRWVLEVGRERPEPAPFFRELCHRLRAAGIPVARMACGMPTLHPQVHAVTWMWSDDRDEPWAVPRPHGIESTPEYKNSPIALVDAGVPFLRRRLTGPGAVLDFPILHELRAAGFTDYVVYPLLARGVGRYAAAWATRAEGGFGDDAARALRELEPALSLVLQLFAAARTTTSLLATYLGATAAERVLEGHVLRGDSENLDAVLWYCDLRDFTAMSEARPRDEVITVLNDYFACVGEPIERGGGEILKLIGDAVLAVFRVGEPFATRAAACRAALTASAEAFARLDRWTAERGRPWHADGASEAWMKRPLRCGVALHVGEVFFGNVGTPSRLDFTVIGPAVNLACRLGELCKTLGQPLLLSADFAAHATIPLKDMGEHLIRGVASKQRVFTPELLSPELLSPELLTPEP